MDELYKETWRHMNSCKREILKLSPEMVEQWILQMDRTQKAADKELAVPGWTGKETKHLMRIRQKGSVALLQCLRTLQDCRVEELELIKDKPNPEIAAYEQHGAEFSDPAIQFATTEELLGALANRSAAMAFIHLPLISPMNVSCTMRGSHYTVLGLIEQLAADLKKKQGQQMTWG